MVGWLVEEPVPNKSSPSMSSFACCCTVDGPFFAWPGPIMALLGSVFFYFLAFSLMNIFISVARLAGSSLYPGSTKVSSGSFFEDDEDALIPMVLRVCLRIFL